ncbi:MAG: 2-oxoacid:acceptor oxidoreductase family protein [Sulfolobaceae archaeon]
MLEIRFHGRGGQGVVTAANVLAEAAYFEGLWSSSFPIYGAERRGAEIEAYCRISDKPIRITSPIENPDYIVVIDPTLLYISQNVYRGIKPTTEFIINSFKSNIMLDNIKNKLYIINATKIAKELGLVKSGWPMVNIVILGALIKVIKIISLNSLKKAIFEEFEGKIAELNAKAVEIAYDSIKEVELVVS